MPLFTGTQLEETQLFVSGGSLVVVCLSFAEGRLLVAHGSRHQCGQGV